MSKINKILIALVVVLLIVLAGVIYWQKGGFEKPYYAVYLSTGDIYFGQLSHSPKLTLSNVWFLQKDANNPQAGFSLAKFDKAFWGPQDEMILNEKDVVWMTELRSDSQILQAMNNPQPTPNTQGTQSGNQQLPAQIPAQNPTATTTNK